MDQFDEKIVRALQRDGRMSNAALAKIVNLSESACLRRLKRLEQEGVILGYTAIVDHKANPSAPLAITMITLQDHRAATVRAFELAVRKIVWVKQCHHVTGSFDYLLFLNAPMNGDFKTVHDEYLLGLPGVARFQSCFTLKQVV